MYKLPKKILSMLVSILLCGFGSVSFSGGPMSLGGCFREGGDVLKEGKKKIVSKLTLGRSV